MFTRGHPVSRFGPSEFSAGTMGLFQQSTAPLGWVKQTTHNDKTLRVVSGAASSGGSVAFSTFFGRTATDNVTLATGNLSAHTHDPSVTTITLTAGAAVGFGATPNRTTSTIGGSAGSGTAFTAAIDCRVQYVDIIIARKS